MKLNVGHFLCPVMDFPEGISGALERCGDYTPSNKRIRVCSSLPGTEQAETLIHEVLHACYDAFGWGMTEALNEEQVCTLVAKGLSMVFQANPMLHEVLHQALTHGKSVV